MRFWARPRLETNTGQTHHMNNGEHMRTCFHCSTFLFLFFWCSVLTFCSFESVMSLKFVSWCIPFLDGCSSVLFFALRVAFFILDRAYHFQLLLCWFTSFFPKDVMRTEPPFMRRDKANTSMLLFRSTPPGDRRVHPAWWSSQYSFLSKKKTNCFVVSLYFYLERILFS